MQKAMASYTYVSGNGNKGTTKIAQKPGSGITQVSGK